ncbi:right-handed parallel beta-helix repeat-containing protein [Patescibacteria group bacterium]|nr:right-handed parallel beta-helix repeat-containing protein [Patescibacteria group bacterium]
MKVSKIKGKKLTATLLIAVFILSTLTIAIPVSAVGITWYVDDTGPNDPGSGTEADPFRAILSAITAAAEDDTILVAAGTYDEDVTIDKSLTLLSVEGKDNTIINGQLGGWAAALGVADGVSNVVIGDTGQGFTINAEGVAAIYLIGSGIGNQGITIRDNKLVAATGTASKSALLTGGLQSDHTITGNTFQGDSSQLVYVNGQVSLGKPSTSVDFIGNTFAGTATGPALGQEATDSEISGNTFATVNGWSLELWAAGNTIIGNDFTADQPAGGLYVKDSTGTYDIATILSDNVFLRAVTVDHPSSSLLPNIWSNIQDALDATTTGDTVQVYPGTYEEILSIGKSLTLQADSSTVLLGTIDVQDYADDTTIDGFTIQPTSEDAVHVRTAGNVAVTGCTIVGQGPTGGVDGIVYTHGSPADAGSVIGNTITDCELGIYLDHDGLLDFTVTGNALEGCRKAIGLGTLSGAIIDDNTITGSTQIGIELCHGAAIEHNTLLNNNIGICLLGAVDGTNIGSEADGADANTINGSTEYDIHASGATGPVDIWEDNVYDTILLENSNLIYVHVTLGEPADVTVTGDGSVDAPDADTTVGYTGADGCTVTVEDIDEDEVEEATFSAVGDYVDVKIKEGDIVKELEIRVYYTDADIVGLVEANLRMYWYEDPNWRACSDTGVDTVNDYIWAKIRTDTSPSLSQMTGTPFGPGDSMTLDSEYYKKFDEITVDAGHGSANTDPIRIDTMEVYAKSTTDTKGITVELAETGVDTGIFTGSFLTTDEIPPPVGYLVVSEGDTVVVSHDGVEVTATIDEKAPVFDAETPVSGEDYYSNTDTIELVANLDEAGYIVTADFSSIDSECTGDKTFTDNGGSTYSITYTIDEENTRIDGEYTITVTAEDVAGNIATYDFIATLDNTEPSVTDAVADPSLIQPEIPTDITFTATVSDSGSDVASVTIDLTEIGGEVEEMDGEGSGPYTYTCEDVEVDTDGDYDLPITAIDNIGNTNTESIILHVVADTEGPTDVSFTEVESICGGLIVKGLSAEDILTEVKEFKIYVDEDELDIITVGALDSTTWTDGLYKGTFVLDLSGYVDTTVEVTVVAYDNADNPSDPVTLYAGKVPKGEWYAVELYEGWNLVSLPLIPDSSATGDILSLILDQGASGVVFSYGYDQYTDTWITNPTEMPDGYGYWLYAKDYDVMIVEGIQTPPAPSLPATYEFTKGWVLAGYKQIAAHEVNEYLGSLEAGSYFGTVYAWNAEIPNWYTFSGEQELSPGMGFWIWMHSDQSLITPLEVL